MTCISRLRLHNRCHEAAVLWEQKPDLHAVRQLPAEIAQLQWISALQLLWLGCAQHPDRSHQSPVKHAATPGERHGCPAAQGLDPAQHLRLPGLWLLRGPHSSEGLSHLCSARGQQLEALNVDSPNKPMKALLRVLGAACGAERVDKGRFNRGHLFQGKLQDLSGGPGARSCSLECNRLTAACRHCHADFAAR